MKETDMTNRPALYLSCASLARELDVSETTVARWSPWRAANAGQALSGCVRWCWADVEAALASLMAGETKAVLIRSWRGAKCQRHRCAVTLPKGVHRVISRGREYFYYSGRARHGPRRPRVRLAQRSAVAGVLAGHPAGSGHRRAGADRHHQRAGDAYETAWPTLPRKLSDATKEQYRRSLRVVRTAWGDLRADALRPSHVQALMEGLATSRARRTTCWTRCALCADGPWVRANCCPVTRLWALRISQTAKATSRGRRSSLKVADEKFTGMLRRAYVLARYTGQRISDVVRLGFTDIDDGGLALARRKPACGRGARSSPSWRQRWRLGRSGRGRSCCRTTASPSPRTSLWKVFDKAREDHPELADAVWHGLRANAVIHLRQSGYSIAQISDMIGMSPPMVERYCRHADRKAGGQAVLLALKQGKNKNETVKR